MDAEKVYRKVVELHKSGKAKSISEACIKMKVPRSTFHGWDKKFGSGTNVGPTRSQKKNKQPKIKQLTQTEIVDLGLVGSSKCVVVAFNDRDMLKEVLSSLLN